MPSQGKLFVVGIGPGSAELMTLKARRAIEESEYVVGYKSYIQRISEFLEGKKVVSTPMRGEVERVEMALELVKTSVVALVSGGDPSMYGILPLVVEYAVKNGVEIEIEPVPGVSAVNAASALLGSAISGDHAVVSLSDLLVPWSVVEKRLIYALRGDFVVAIYNPSSRRRKPNLLKALEIIRAIRGECFVGVVRNAFREGQSVKVMRLSELEEKAGEVDMNTLLIVGNSETAVAGGKMYTPRGYARKYSIGSKPESDLEADGPEAEPELEAMGASTKEGRDIASRSREILRKLHPEEGLRGEIVRRCIATTGDVSIKDVLVFKGDTEEGVRAIKSGARIIADVHMVAAGLRKQAIVAVDFAESVTDTKTASGIRKLAKLVEGSVVAIGNSPSAALALYEIAKTHPPRFIVATPVGFVNAAESKELIRSLDVPSVTTSGSRGGSGICAAIVNVLIEYAGRSD